MPLFDPFTLGTSANQVLFNDDNSSPYFRVIRRTPTRRQIEEFDIKLPEGTGDADFQSYIGKTYMLIEGTMYPDDEVGFDNGRKQLRKVASLDVQQSDATSDQGYVPLKWDENDGYDKKINVKVMYVDIPEATRGGIKQPFRMLCKIKYPVILSQTAVGGNIGDSGASVSGSSYLPWVLPKVVGATSYSSSGSLNNAGDMPAYPSFVITGPINLPRITNSTTGEYIEVSHNLASGSDSMIITYDQDTTILTVAGNSVLGSLTSGSTLFKIRPGTNTLTLTGSSVGSGAFATVSFNHTWPLS